MSNLSETTKMTGRPITESRILFITICAALTVVLATRGAAACGGCTVKSTSPQPQCVTVYTVKVKYQVQQRYDCHRGWWWFKRHSYCYRTVSAYRQEYRQGNGYCCAGFNHQGSSCFKIIPVTPVPPTPSPAPLCGQTNVAVPQIVGGTDATPGEFPWQVSLRGMDGQHFCGGTIVGVRWIMTAAHCVSGRNQYALTVKVGEYNLTSQRDPGEVMMKVNTIFVHEHFTSSPLINDIALLKMDDDITFNTYVGMACLPSSSENIFDQSHEITGWGQYEPGLRGPPLSSILQKAHVKVIPSNNCRGFHMAGKLCVVDGEDGRQRSSCFGDSGGPLMTMTKNGVTIQGVASGVSSIGCAVGLPFAYTDVGQYIGWIEGKIG